MLAAIGSAPVTSMTGNVSRDVATCVQLLEKSRRHVLLEGWTFNVKEEVQYTPRTDDNRIRVGTKVFEADVSPAYDYKTVDVEVRGAWLYDKKARSYTFGSALYLDIKEDMEWDELPLAAQHYIAAHAAEAAVRDLNGDATKIRAAETHTVLSRGSMMRHDTKQGDFTIYDPSTESQILHRRR